MKTQLSKLLIFSLFVIALGSCKKDAEMPNGEFVNLKTSEATEITAVSAVVSAKAKADCTERGVCWGKKPNPTIDDFHVANGSGKGDYTCTLTDLEPNQKYYYRAYAFDDKKAECVYANDEKNFTTTPEGVINGLFTINANGDQVWFSKGNLQYQASTNTWRFAEKQWDYIGGENANISPSYSDWIDLFGWGTSGYNHGAGCYQPWSSTEGDGLYYAYGEAGCSLYDHDGKADWGYNAISNGGNVEHQWRTLTGGNNGEWLYIFSSRNTASGIRYAKACVNAVNGIILVPDNWNAYTYLLNSPNSEDAHFSANRISSDLWDNTFEPAGCVFLPAAGIRQLDSSHAILSVAYMGATGYYWSASHNNSGNYACNFLLFNSNNIKFTSDNRQTGRSVRLVSDY